MPHQGQVASLMFSPDGEYLATASYDRNARVWEAQSGEEVARIKHDGILRGVAISPDGEYIATASADETARARPWRGDGLAEEACARVTRNLTREEWRLYVGGMFYDKTCENLPGPEG